MIDTKPQYNLSIIVAVAQNMAIGRDNDLLWHLSDDLKRFKSLTSGHTVIMGRRTFDSLSKKPLPKRRNIVRVQVVTYKNDLVGIWIHVVKKPFDTFSPVHPGSLLFRLCMSPACKWLCE